MAKPFEAELSAIRWQHLAISAGVFATAAAGIAGASLTLGDPADAGPRVELSLPKMKAEPPAPVAPAAQLGPIQPMPGGQLPPGMSREVFLSPPTGAGLPVPDMATGPAPGAPGAAAAPGLAPPPLAQMGPVRILAPGTGARPAAAGQKGPPLAPAPIAGLHQPSPNGPLPIVAGGRSASEAYARPFTDRGGPRVSLMVGGLGLNAAATQRAIDRLPSEVTLSFVPYADNLQSWINKARAAGHEVMLEIPMEPMDYPNNDPGPQTLLSSAAPEENVRRLENLLGRGTGYFGVTNYLGARFAQSEAAGPLFQALRGRGLAFVSDGGARGLGAAAGGAGVPTAAADRVIDARPSSQDISAALDALEALARARGAAVGAGVAYPVTIDEVTRWAGEAQRRGVQLAPVSAAAQRRTGG